MPLNLPIPGGDSGTWGTKLNELLSDELDGRLSEASLSATIAAEAVPKWKPNTAYAAGDRVVNPGGDVVLAKAAFTSGATYDATQWNLPATETGPVVAAERKFRAKQQALRAPQNVSQATLTGPSANSAASAIVSAVRTNAVLTPGAGGTINPLFVYLRARPKILGTAYPNYAVVAGDKISWPSAAPTEATLTVLVNHEGATTVEFGVQSSNAMRVVGLCDGKPTNLTPLVSATANGFEQYYTMTLPDTRRHEIGIATYGSHSRFMFVNTAPTAVLSRVTRPIGRRLVVATDSQGEPSGPAPLYLGYHYRWPEQVAQLLGIEDVHVTPMGSTGYRANSGGTRYTLGERLQADVLDANPTDVLFHCGQNDNITVGGVVFSEANFRAAVVDVLSRTRAALPFANIIVNTQLHPYAGNSAVIYDVLKQEAANYGATLVDLKGFLTGTGNEGAAGSGNRDELISSDDSHLSVRGHDALAPYVAARIETGSNNLVAPVGYP